MSWHVRRLSRNRYLARLDVPADSQPGFAALSGSRQTLVEAYRQQRHKDSHAFDAWLKNLKIERPAP